MVKEFSSWAMFLVTKFGHIVNTLKLSNIGSSKSSFQTVPRLTLYEKANLWAKALKKVENLRCFKYITVEIGHHKKKFSNKDLVKTKYQ